MSGLRREWEHPVLRNGEDMAVRNEEEAEMLVWAFVQVHSSNNLMEEGKRGREGVRKKRVGIEGCWNGGLDRTMCWRPHFLWAR